LRGTANVGVHRKTSTQMGAKREKSSVYRCKRLSSRLACHYPRRITMKNSKSSRVIAVVSLSVAFAACTEPDRIAGTKSPTMPALSVSTAAVTAIDISNGFTGGGGRTISSTGIILGRIGTTRGWWTSPSPAFTPIDDNYVQGGNRNADAGGGDGTAILSTNGGPPWTSVTLASPAGIAAGKTIAHDINNLRVLVGKSFGPIVNAIRWDSPSAVPIVLPLPPLQYPAYQVTARSINNNNVIVGYVLETLPRNRSRYEALVWSGGTVSILPLPQGGTSQLASNINDAGVISGITEGSHPIRWTPKIGGGYDIAVSSIDVGGSNLDTGIDACGRITGGSDSGAWVWDGVSPAVILPGLAGPGHWGQASDISESGTAVGSSFVGTSKGSRVTRATIWTGLPACTP